MTKLILLALFYLLFPIVLIWLTRKSSFLKKLGTIVLAYAFGLILGNIGVIPHGSEAFHEALSGRAAIPAPEMEQLLSQGVLSENDASVNALNTMQDLIMSIIIPLAIPLLLFSLNVKRWMKFAKAGFVSMILALISVIVIIITGHLIFSSGIHNAWQVSGMLVGVYTGGTPNLAAIKTALGVDSNLYLYTHTYDMIVGAVTLIFFITVGQRVFGLILPPFKKDENAVEIDESAEEFADLDDFSGMFARGSRLPLLKSLGISVLIFAASAGLSFVFPKVPMMIIVILGITTLGLGASLVSWINNIRKTFQLGMYFILIFSLIVASLANLSVMFTIEYLNLFLYVTYAYFGSLLLHLALSAIFKVDTDNFLITTTALVYSPPFVPVVAAALKNKEVIITGLTVGIIGYVVGNYLGIAMALFLKGL